MVTKPSRDRLHLNIPKDANGDPIFLILPDGIRASYEHRMALCVDAWQATGDPLVVSEAQTWTFTHRQPIPAWLHDAVAQLASSRRSKSHAKRALEAAVHSMRHQAVRDAKATGVSSAKAYDRASEVLADMFAAGEPATMKASYERVLSDLRKGRGGRYHTIKSRRRKPAAPAG